MLRTAFGAFEALLGSAGAATVRATTTKGGNTAGRRIWTARTSARAPWTPWQQRAMLSQLRASSRSTITRYARRPGQLKTQFATRAPRRPFHSSRPRRAADATSKTGNAAGEESLSLSARLKKLSREYGWTSVGVYFALSVLDFPFCFLLVRTVGTERIAHVEHVVMSNVQKVIPERVQEWWREYRQALKEAKLERTGEGGGDLAIIHHGVEEAEQRSKQEGASLATQLALAYAIHKSFIFFRVPLTAAVTPKVVKVLRSWGWQIGKRKAKR